MQLGVILEAEPPRDFAAVTCIRAWCDLSTCRPIGMAVGPIPVTAIYTWCEVEGLDREATLLIKNVIRQLDVDRAEHEAAKASRDRAYGKDKR